MNLLVIRFSAMGDVALLTPALIAVVAKYPNVQINLITRGNFSSFFFNIPNVHVIGLNLKKYKFLFQQLQLTPEGITIHTHRIIIGEIITIYLLFQSDTCYKLKKIKNYINKQTKT